jgi:hypothetical protein
VPPLAAAGLCILLIVLNLNIGHIAGPPTRPSKRGVPQRVGAAPVPQQGTDGSPRSGVVPITSNNSTGSHAQTAALQARPKPAAKDRVLPAARSSSVLTDLQGLIAGSNSNTKTGIDKDRELVQVWISKYSGYYYCSDSRYYERLQPGTFMAQGRALQSGYQPKLSQLCD